MTSPSDEAQVAEIQRQGWKRAAVTGPIVALAIAAGLLTHGALRDRLSATLYVPACGAACSAAGGRAIGHRPGGRGHTGEVRCECAGTAETWHDADLSRGSVGDKALHYGGQEALSLLAFVALAVPGLALGMRVFPVRTGS
jgi:hypothetical protein